MQGSLTMTTTGSTHTDKPLFGILIVDKPLGCSSMDVIRVVRRHANRAKTGHAGTLDPLATGVVVVCLGRATKAVEYLMLGEKVYEAQINLTAFTTTDDAEGTQTIVDRGELSPPTLEEIDKLIQSQFVGKIMQAPPAFSAMKVNGRRAYKLARKGEKVVIPEREVTIRSIEIRSYAWPLLDIVVVCGKGTYIRSLARDLGKFLGTGGFLSGLRRSAVGPYTLERSVRLDDVPDPLLQEHLLPVPKEAGVKPIGGVS